jgi:hypothetical protein
LREAPSIVTFAWLPATYDEDPRLKPATRNESVLTAPFDTVMLEFASSVYVPPMSK